MRQALEFPPQTFLFGSRHLQPINCALHVLLPLPLLFVEVPPFSLVLYLHVASVLSQLLLVHLVNLKLLDFQLSLLGVLLQLKLGLPSAEIRLELGPQHRLILLQLNLPLAIESVLLFAQNVGLLTLVVSDLPRSFPLKLISVALDLN